MKKLILGVFVVAAGLGLARGAAVENQSPQELARQIIAAFESGQVEQVKANLKSTVTILAGGAKSFPQDSRIHFALGNCYMMQGDVALAVNSLDKAYQLSNKDFRYGMRYALALKMNKQLLKAHQVSKEMAAAHPDVPQLQIWLAVLDTGIQKYDDALWLIDSLWKKLPANFPANEKGTFLLIRGTCQLYKGEREKAIGTLEEALANFTNSAVIMCVLGEAYVKNGELEKARRVLERALKINPKIPPALFYQGICFELAGQREAAEKNFQNCFAFGKERLNDNGENYFLMALVCDKLSKGEEAAKYRKQAEELLFTYEAPWRK